MANKDLIEDVTVITGDGLLCEGNQFSSPFEFQIEFEKWPEMMDGARDQLRHAAREFAYVLFHLGVGSGQITFKDNRQNPEPCSSFLDPAGRRTIMPATLLVHEGRYISSIELIAAFKK